jgi:anti-sigma B factor antagonist
MGGAATRAASPVANRCFNYQEGLAVMELNIGVRQVGDVAVLDLNGELDTYSCPALRSAVVNLVDRGQRNILLNMAGVEYIDSAGLGTLVGGLKRTTEHGGQLKLVNTNSQIQKVLNITGLVRVFEQFSSEEEAIKSFVPAPTAAGSADDSPSS